MSIDHNHPDLDLRLERLTTQVERLTLNVSDLTGAVREVVQISRAILASVESIDVRLGRVEEAIRRITPNGHGNTQP
jgi:hypothetical protein